MVSFNYKVSLKQPAGHDHKKMILFQLGQCPFKLDIEKEMGDKGKRLKRC